MLCKHRRYTSTGPSKGVKTGKKSRTSNKSLVSSSSSRLASTFGKVFSARCVELMCVANPANLHDGWCDLSHCVVGWVQMCRRGLKPFTFYLFNDLLLYTGKDGMLGNSHREIPLTQLRIRYCHCSTVLPMLQRVACVTAASSTCVCRQPHRCQRHGARLQGAEQGQVFPGAVCFRCGGRQLGGRRSGPNCQTHEANQAHVCVVRVFVAVAWALLH